MRDFGSLKSTLQKTHKNCKTHKEHQMAIGKINSLGAGSGVLSYEVIDKLRDADEKAMVKPIERKMELNVEKQKTLTEIQTLISGLRGPVKTLGDYSSYLGRSTEINNDAIKASVASGVPPQDIKIDVHSLAQGDINEVGGKFESRDSVFSDNDAKLTFYTKGRSYTIDIYSGMTLGDVAQAITDATNGEVIGTVMKTGGPKPYQLMMNSKGMGDESRIYFGSMLRTDNISSNTLDLQDGDLTLTLKDKKGESKSVNIKLKTDGLGDSTLALKEAIKEAIAQDDELKDLLDNQIHIGLDKDGKGLIINDVRGNEIKIEGAKARELGFRQTKTDEDPIYSSSNAVKAGKLSGIITIGTVPLDLAKMTKEKNSSEQNAKIIAEAIENIAGMHAKTDGQGHLELYSEVGEIQISTNTPADKQALEDTGLRAGKLQNYTKLQESLFKVRNVQKAQDAEISYNGARVSRPSNEINDIINGVSLTLKSTTEEGKPAIISIGRDNEAIIEQVKDFVKAYNELIPKLDESTRFDEDSKIAGIFNGVSDIRSIRTALNREISYSELVNNQLRSLMNYGISLNDKGVMLLDESKLKSQVATQPQETEEFFYGYEKQNYKGEDVHIDGIFVKIDKFLAGLVDGSESRLESFSSSLERDAKKLQKDKKNANELLDSKYEAMASRFAAFDSQIAKTKNAFGSVQMMIDQSIARK